MSPLRKEFFVLLLWIELDLEESPILTHFRSWIGFIYQKDMSAVPKTSRLCFAQLLYAVGYWPRQGHKLTIMAFHIFLVSSWSIERHEGTWHALTDNRKDSSKSNLRFPCWVFWDMHVPDKPEKWRWDLMNGSILMKLLWNFFIKIQYQEPCQEPTFPKCLFLEFLMNLEMGLDV